MNSVKRNKTMKTASVKSPAEKSVLLSSIREALSEYAGDKTIMVKAAARLNQRGIKTSNGQEWTRKSLGRYVSSNRSQLAQLPQEESQKLFTQEEVIRGFLNKMSESLGRGSKSETLLFIAVDRGLLGRVKTKSSSENITLADAFDVALNQWVKKKRLGRKVLAPAYHEEETGGIDCDLPFDREDHIAELSFIGTM